MDYRPPKKRKLDYEDWKGGILTEESRNEQREEPDWEWKEEAEYERVSLKNEILSFLKYLPLIFVIFAIILIIGIFFPEYIAVVVLGGLVLIMVPLWCRERLRYW